MKRKHIILIAGIAVFILLAGLLISEFKRSDPQISQNISLVPVDANMLLKINEPFKLINYLETQPAFWKDLTNAPAFNKLSHKMTWLDSISAEHDVIRELLSGGNLVVSVHDIGKRKIGYMFIAEIPESIKNKAVSREINALIKEDETNARNYEGVTIYDFSSQSLDNYAYSIFNGNLFFSNNALLIEDAIRQSNSPASILNDKGFQEVYATAGKKELVNCYIKLSRLNHLIMPFLKAETEDNHPAIKNYASWIELDMSLNESLISFNGFAVTPDSTLNYLNHIKEQSATSADFESVLPENTAMFYAMSLDNDEAFISYRKSYLDQHKYANYYDDKIQSFNETSGSDLDKMLFSLIDDQVCFALTNINQLDIFQNSYLLIETKSESKAQKQLRNFLTSYTEKTKQDISEYISTMEMDAFNSYTVYRLPVDEWPEVLLGSFFGKTTPKYCSLLDNTLIFAPSESALRRFFNNYLLNRTINKNNNYQEFKENLSRKYHVYFYVNTNLAYAWISNLMNTKYDKKLDNSIDIVKKHQQIALQQTVSDEMIYHNLVVRHRNYQNEKPHTIWESRLDAPLKSKPVVVENHNTGLKEIFVQDVENNIYLINQQGHILWKNPLDEPVISDIYQIDRYKNQKLQYLFNTRSRIYLIDRLGNHVERFPINLRSPANCGLALFDYNNDRDYRILIPAKNKAMYLYNKKGNIIPGWKFEKSEYPVEQTPQHIKDDNKDYIVFHDKYRIYLLNRKGEPRVQPKYQFAASKANKFYFEEKENQKSSLVITNQQGTVMRIYMDGDIDSLNLQTCSPQHYFMYKDIDSDGVRDYIFLDENKLNVYNQNKKKIMTYKFENSISDPPGFYVFSKNEHEIGITDKEKEMIYLINDKGKLHPGFPLVGISPFSISYINPTSDNFNLFVGGKDNFLYNYEVK
ncbi:MAG: DUF3352 domain-containing protein [Bacteroidales bacterium]